MSRWIPSFPIAQCRVEQQQHRPKSMCWTSTTNFELSHDKKRSKTKQTEWKKSLVISLSEHLNQRQQHHDGDRCSLLPFFFSSHFDIVRPSHTTLSLFHEIFTCLSKGRFSSSRYAFDMNTLLIYLITPVPTAAVRLDCRSLLLFEFFFSLLFKCTVG